MTITTTKSAVTLQGNGAAPLFPFTFLIPGAGDGDQTNVIVTVVDTTVQPQTSTVLADNLFTITGVGDPDGGSVTYPLAGGPLAAGKFITIQRSLADVQGTTISNQSNFYGNVLEAAYDYLTMLVQQLQTQLNLCYQRAVSDPAGAPPTLPLASTLAGKYAAFDVNGNLIGILALGTWRGVWVTAGAYNQGDMVIDGVNGADTGNYYIALSANISGVWATDLAAGKWALAINVASIVAAAGAAAAASAAAAAVSAATATTEAGVATTQAGDAATSATAANASAATATTEADVATTEAGVATAAAATATTEAGVATTEAGVATAAAATATTEAAAANASATLAATLAAGVTDTSASSVLIGTGAKNFACSAGKQFAAGQFISIVSRANNANYMHGQVTSYNAGTGALVVNVTDIGGAGTFADWNVSISGSQGSAAAGAVGGPGAPTVVGNVAGWSNTLGTAINDTGVPIASLAPLASPALTGNPTATTQATSDSTTKLATTAFVQALLAAATAGLDFKNPVAAATTGALTAIYVNGVSGVGATLTNSGALAALALDGQSPAVGARVLVKNQASAFQNGIYTVTTVGSGAVAWVLTRATDYNTAPSEIAPGDLVPVEFGTINGGSVWLQTATVNTMGTDSISFQEYLFPAGTFAQIANNLSDLANAATARTNLGLGTAATGTLGTGANDVVQLTAAAKLPAVDGSLLTNLPASGPVLLTTLTASNSASLTDTTHLTSAYSRYEFVFLNLKLGNVSGGAIPAMYVSTNGGSSYDTTDANYAVAGGANAFTTGSSVGGMFGSGAVGGGGGGGYVPLDGKITLYLPATVMKHAFRYEIGNDDTNGAVFDVGGGTYIANTTAINAIKITSTNGGTYQSGAVQIWGIP